MIAVETPTPQQSDMFPDDVPDFVIRYWSALRHWWESTGRRAPPLREQLLKVYNRDLPDDQPRMELRTFDRYRSFHKRWLGSWPPKYNERPPWDVKLPGDDDHEVFNVYPGPVHELRRTRTPVVDESGRPAIRVDEYDTVTHRVIHSYIDFAGSLAAGIIAVASVLDILCDGRLDGVMHLCHLVSDHVVRG